MTSSERKALEAQFAIGLESAAALAAQGKSVCQVINESRDDRTTIVRMHPEFRGRLPWGTELYVRAAPQPAQQAVDAPYDHGPQAETVDEALRDVSKWLNEHPNRPLDLRHVAMLCHALSAPKPEQQSTSHPMQPVEIVGGVARFKKNAMVDHLYEWAVARGMGMNEMAAIGFSTEDWMQFAQLIGYSVSGYGDLSYVTDESYDAAASKVPDLLKPAQQAGSPK